MLAKYLLEDSIPKDKHIVNIKRMDELRVDWVERYKLAMLSYGIKWKQYHRGSYKLEMFND